MENKPINQLGHTRGPHCRSRIVWIHLVHYPDPVYGISLYKGTKWTGNLGLTQNDLQKRLTQMIYKIGPTRGYGEGVFR